jgi:23S rRNA (guanosine2251-2'-O)-methyltransferase
MDAGQMQGSPEGAHLNENRGKTGNMTHLEGKQSILSALKVRQRKFQVILVRHDAHEEKVQEVLDAAAEFAVPVRRVDSKELDALAHGTSHGGVLAVVTPKLPLSSEQLLERVSECNHPALLLLLEGVDDARNLGFTLRTAEAMGVDAVLIKKHLWDFDETEVARPASGAFERMPLARIEGVETIRELQKGGMQVVGCIAGAKRTIYEVDLTRPTMLAIGGEKRGLSGAVREICDLFVTIPTVGEATSLSLSHAGAIVMAEAMRQRKIRPLEDRDPSLRSG